jgi:GNAT superfamily N-acetyltransferase
MTPELRTRRYEPRDAGPVWTLHEWALRDAGTDPEDVPGVEDLRGIEATYFEAGGDFLVGTLPEATSSVEKNRERPDPEPARHRPPRVNDGLLVAMGGYLPCAANGSAANGRSDRDRAELHRMRVAPTHQRSGYGKRLLAALERRARTAGFDRLLATTAARQRGAIRFYPAAGYTETGRSATDEYELIDFEKPL